MRLKLSAYEKLMVEGQATESDEYSLIKRTSAGDHDAFQQLYLIYEKRLFAYLMKVVSDQDDAEDLIVEIMLAVWQGAGTFRGRSKPSTWIFGIAHNKAMTKIAARAPTVGLEHANGLESSAPAPDARHLRQERSGRIRAALRRLSAEHREVIELTFYHGLSYREIAQIVKCPLNTIKTRMFYAKQRLRQILSGQGFQGEP